MIAGLGVLGMLLVCAFFRLPDVKLWSPITIWNRKQKLTKTGANLYAVSFGIVLLGLLVAVLARSGVIGGLPACGDSGAKELLTNAFDQSQFARTMNLSVVDVSNPREVSGDGKSKRLCRAQISLNNAENASVKYLLEAKAGGDVLLTFEVE